MICLKISDRVKLEVSSAVNEVTVETRFTDEVVQPGIIQMLESVAIGPQVLPCDPRCTQLRRPILARTVDGLSCLAGLKTPEEKLAKPVIVRRLAHTRLRDLPNWVTNTRLEWARTQTPEPISSRRAISTLFPEITADEVEEYRLEFLRNTRFFEALDTAMLARRGRRCRWVSWVEFLYVAVRIMKPELVCETGVFDGESSAVELLALETNQKGSLISIDLPAFGKIAGSTDQMIDAILPPACQPGWIVPESLRERWQLVLGDSRRLLSDILNDRGVVDIFFHDSLHTFDHMYFEYTTAWPYIRDGGLLVSDDILWSHAFHRFCRERQKQYVNVADRNHIYWTASNEGFGAVRK